MVTVLPFNAFSSMPRKATVYASPKTLFGVTAIPVFLSFNSPLTALTQVVPLSKEASYWSGSIVLAFTVIVENLQLNLFKSPTFVTLLLAFAAYTV